MSKHLRKQVDRQGEDLKAITVQIPIPVLGVLVDAREAFHDLCVETGQQALRAMMEADRVTVCGPKGRHDPARQAYRGGSTRSWVTLGGRQIAVPRLRARGAEGECVLPSFAWAAERDPLDAHTLEAIAAGVSSRRYGRSLERLRGEVAERATSRSAVSRRFVALTTRQMHTFLSRPLDDLDVRVVMIDGKAFREHCLLIALGIDVDGKKHVLGIREGTTENTQVAKALLSELVGRGLRTDRPVLFVIDGAKALRKAIRELFGALGKVHRCQHHKQENILEHLPQGMRPSVRRALRDAWDTPDASLAHRQLKRLAGSLEQKHPGAAASIREGLEETLTLQRLGVSGALYRTLRTTNPIENLNGSIATYTRNVKRWRGGSMILRWVSAALLEAQKQFRRVRGYREMPRLVAALDTLHPEGNEESMVA